LIHPFGLLYSEVTASSLLKVNPDGSVVDQGSTNLGVNKAGMLLHSAIHGARKDARAIIHLHQDAIVAVSFKLHFRKPVLRPATFVVLALFNARFFFDKLVLIIIRHVGMRCIFSPSSISLCAKLALFILSFCFPTLLKLP